MRRKSGKPTQKQQLADARQERKLVRVQNRQQQLELLAELEQLGFTQEEMAAKVGLTRPIIHDLLSTLTEQGIISHHSRRPSYPPSKIFQQRVRRYAELALEKGTIPTSGVRVKLLSLLVEELEVEQLRFIIQVMETAIENLLLPESPPKDAPYLLLLKAVCQSQSIALCFWPEMWRCYLEQVLAGTIPLPSATRELQISLIAFCIKRHRHRIAPIWKEGEAKDIIGEQLATLSPQTRKVLSWFYGMGTSCSLGQVEIRKRLGISRQQVQNVINNGQAELQSPARLASLEILIRPITDSLELIKERMAQKDLQIQQLQKEVERLRVYEKEAEVRATILSDISLIPILTIRVHNLNISTKLANCLTSTQVTYIGDLVKKHPHELRKVWSVGTQTFEQAKELLRSYGLQLGSQFTPELEAAFEKAIEEQEAREEAVRQQIAQELAIQQEETIKILELPIEGLEIDTAIKNALKRASIFIVGALVTKTQEEMEGAANRIGPRTIQKIKGALQSLGLSFNMRLDPSIRARLENKNLELREEGNFPYLVKWGLETTSPSRI